MSIKVCIAGVTGWTGSVVGQHLLASDEFEVVGAIARSRAGRDIGEALGRDAIGVAIQVSLEEVLAGGARPDVLVDYTDLPSWEIIDYAGASKVDSPSGTTMELAEAMGEVATAKLGLPIDQTHGAREVRGASIGGAQVHSVRLPSFVIAFETIFGLPDERLTIRHDAGSGAEPHAGGTLLAISKVMTTTGLIRGLDRLLFGDG